MMKRVKMIIKMKIGMIIVTLLSTKLVVIIIIVDFVDGTLFPTLPQLD